MKITLIINTYHNNKKIYGWVEIKDTEIIYDVYIDSIQVDSWFECGDEHSIITNFNKRFNRMLDNEFGYCGVRSCFIRMWKLYYIEEGLVSTHNCTQTNNFLKHDKFPIKRFEI